MLPQAIANRLARQALAELPISLIARHLDFAHAPRVCKSFARRLGMLHDSKEARGIAASWLGPQGLLSDLASLDDDRRHVFRHIAPTDPALSLRTIEAADRKGQLGATATGGLRSFVAPILCKIAYDPVLFDRSAAVLARIAVLDLPSSNISYCWSIFVALFSMQLSGTMATPCQRATFLRGLFTSPDTAIRQLGVDGLEAWLSTVPYRSGQEFAFGAWSRGFGYFPRTGQEADEWFSIGIDLALGVASTGSESSGKLLAKAMRDLWPRGFAHTPIAAAARFMAARGFWPAGWVALRTALSAVRKQSEPEGAGDLELLVRELGPQSLMDRIQVHVFEALPRGFQDDDDDAPERYRALEERRKQTAEALGAETAGCLVILDSLLPALVASSARLVGAFANGLAKVAEAPALI